MAICAGFALSCSDYFNPENNTVLNGDHYIRESSEIYAGYLGVINKLQDVGDKAILLTDTRAEMMEPTGNCEELTDIYNYKPDLTGNRYADPAEYYDLVISCNDFLQKASLYHREHPKVLDEDHYRGLVSCVVRLKTWAYFTIARIYGEVCWFDDPLLSFVDESSMEHLNLDAALQRCADYLENGYDGINGKYNMDWAEWILSADAQDASAGDYYFWDKMVPDYFILAADIALWQGRYQDVIDLILPVMNAKLEATPLGNNQVTWCCTGSYNSYYKSFFDAASPAPLTAVDVIIYNYANGQRNELLKHFYNDYMLRPSQAGIDRYTDYVFNPRLEGRTDPRRDYFIGLSGDRYYFHKYRKLSGSGRSNPQQDDVHIYLYRSIDLYLMMAEAFNNLGRYRESYSLVNDGISMVYVNEGLLYEGFSTHWTKFTVNGTRSYPDMGLRGLFGLGQRDMTQPDSAFIKTNAPDSPQALIVRKHNDIEILHEIMLEQPGEGKTYPAMVRIARRWNDYNIVANEVCAKYPVEQQAQIRTRILDGGYFVPWDHSSRSTLH